MHDAFNLAFSIVGLVNIFSYGYSILKHASKPYHPGQVTGYPFEMREFFF